MSTFTILVIGIFVTLVCAFFIYFTIRDVRRAESKAGEVLPEGDDSKKRPVSVVSLGEMLGDQRIGVSEHLSRLEEISAWRREHRKILPLLAYLEGAIRDQDIALDEHAEAIRRYHAQVESHEDAIAEHEHADESHDHGRRGSEHEVLEARHAEVREHQRRLRDTHRRASVAMTRCIEALGQ